MSCGFKRMELIMNAARKSSFSPLREKAAQIGIVPYMQSGEAMPSALAKNKAIIPGTRLAIFSAAS